MQSSPILLDFSSAFHHPRAAALATTSGLTNSHSPTKKYRLITSFSPSSTLLASSRRCFTCRFGDSSPRFNSNEDETETETDDEDDYCLTDGKTEELVVGDDGVLIELKKLEKSSRRIRSKIGMEASLDSVWSVLTDYEKLSDFIPGLVVSELVEKEGNRVRLFQMGQQNLALGLKFNAKAVLDCYEKELEVLPHGRRREIDFKMVEGDFQLFEGKWSIEQLDKGIHGEALDLQFKDFRTTLAYTVDVKPKMWLPVRLVEGRLCKEIRTNLMSIRDAAQKVIEGVIHDL
ncbi:hypothetical protein [Arabidopsis thaliana]|jgi:ribosome-associated toxin RatA of RatAB toxin-antitoxin module|uniref:Polyketide cyclase / dehydrase and lipid transport protein n=1 Tax=Arabidopsis thaliana TaxID=3702 RepID=Q9M120_ARATH|nr:Polyketide cyclase / dehydrase and lipid transport protein [Arabidopsis thaliana]AEE82056.1 Polyketide cyclase / dehydrase and lipid transport protein [Arabidopsis thaliana]CAB77735.1 hypothetical protein [Arabidopsis thaliana]|eukprot:NP_192074.1 Polyketide cyclase / dehydrase and lipid transport protein [Arabidopsis thaliana]